MRLDFQLKAKPGKLNLFKKSSLKSKNSLEQNLFKNSAIHDGVDKITELDEADLEFQSNASSFPNIKLSKTLIL